MAVKRTPALIAISLLMISMVTMSTVGMVTLWAAGPPYLTDPSWAKVRAAMNKDLPKTALDELTPLIEKALAEKNNDLAVHGITTRVLLEANVQGNQPSEKVTRMEAEIAKAPKEIKPVLEAVLAQWYWQYFQQNRWRFASRTEIDSPDANDNNFTTWDLKRILSEIDKHFSAALSDADQLKKIAASDYDEFLEQGTVGDDHRPTLYDVVAETAIEFYAAGEQAGSVSQDVFVLSSDSPIFDSTDQFLAWTPESSDTSSVTLKAISLYQDLLAFHQDDEDATARLDWDLARYRFGFNRAVGQSKDDRYKAALRRFSKQHVDHPIRARAMHRLAEQFLSDGDPDLAHEIASEAVSKFPESVGGSRCHDLILKIEQVSISVHTERVWAKPMPSIDVSYKNISKIHFRLVSLDYILFLKSKKYQPTQLSRDEVTALLSRTPVRAWSVDLEPTDDFKQRFKETEIPNDVPIGPYLLLASQHEDFREQSNNISITEVWRSDLALVTRHSNDGKTDGFVVDSNSGKAVSGAKVQVWRRQTGVLFKPTETISTDDQGSFKLDGETSRQVKLLVRHDRDSLGSANPFYQRQRFQPKGRDHSRTVFFTDRAIYRPGQTIQFKGICYWSDAESNDYRTLPDKKVTVMFTDSNGQEIEKRTLRTNDYGSFSASVTAPKNRLMGQMILRINSGPRGATSVRVEEYKRPKFRVEIESPKQTAKLGDEITVTGKATAYTGVPIDGAKVSYRVVRSVRYAPWWYWRCWWMPVSPSPEQEIAIGTTTTDSQGQFDVDFVARPDESINKESEPTFTYRISADVTDTTGETRSDDTRLELRYSAIAATLSAEPFLTSDEPTELSIDISGLFGDASKAVGSVKVYRLKQPAEVTRSPISGHRWQTTSADSEPGKTDPANPNSWELGEMVAELPYETTPSGKASLGTKLDAGLYRCVLDADDGKGNEATAYLQIQVLDPDANQFETKIPFVLEYDSGSTEPGQTFRAIWGSGYDDVRVYVEVVHRDEVLQEFWTDGQRTQGVIEVPIDETMRGGVTMRTTMVRENRIYQRNHTIDVPWTNKQLDIRWERFVSKLEPGAKETWTAIIQSHNNDRDAAIAEMVATLYDASLDAFVPHSFGNLMNQFRTNSNYLNSSFENQLQTLRAIRIYRLGGPRNAQLSYWHFPDKLTRNVWSFGRVMMRRSRAKNGAPMAMMEGAMESDAFGADDEMASQSMMAMSKSDSAGEVRGSESGEPSSEPDPNLDSVTARKNLNETAFFFPQLVSDENGTVRISFTMPEALTQWNFIGFAHDNKLRNGTLTSSTVTAKDLMVQPNPPRFVREGDEIEFTVKVSNQSPTIQTGTVRLSFADARTGDPADDALGNTQTDLPFSIPAGLSKSLSWRISVPDGQGFLTYKAVGSTGKLSDGEEGFLPVISRRVLVTESLPLPIRGKQTKEFKFAKLLGSIDSDSIDHQSLTVQMVSNPSWYAVMALPYLMEYPHECSEQTFNRFYANSLARHIASSDPKIENVFQQWRATPALDSPLEKNQDLKSVLIQESPWLVQAKDESQARRDVGILFEQNRLDNEMQRTFKKLSQMQLSDGSWPWFDGGRSNSYLTLYITTGLGRLRRLGADADVGPAIKALGFLDAWADKKYRDIVPANRDKNHLSSTIAMYLYGRSFFAKDQPIADKHQEALQYWLGQADTHWMDLNVRQSQAQLAVALKRFGNQAKATAIMASIKERSITDEEIGMFWRELEASWWWYQAPIETQAMMIEAFDEVVGDQQAVEDCKVWLLKQKQTQAWSTTKSTADAVYSLLLRGSDLLASNALVEVSLGGKEIEPENVEAGTGFYEERFVGESVKPDMGDVTVKKIDDGVAWGSVHWQYLEDMSKVTPHDGTPLKLTKQLYVKKNTRDGPKLTRVEGPVEVGDELVVRIVLRTDRDMEFVHLKDHRGSGTEPVNVLSRYKQQDGLRYYESTRDTASHFFIDYLPKGDYVFEYSTRVQLRGEYQTGFANVQCMYAPEFDAHSESLPIVCE